MMADSNRDTPAARESILTPLSILLFSRFGLMLLAYLGLALIQVKGPVEHAIPGNLFLDGWIKWDSFWVSRIVTNGYTNKPIDDSGQRDVVNMPLYPLAVRGLGRCIGSIYIAGLLISNVSFLLAGLMLYRLVEWKWDSELARRTLILFCVYPFSYTFSAMYTESLFVLCALSAFWCGEKRWWLPAAVCAAAAGATRVVGIATVVALFIMYMQNAGWRRQNIRWDALWLLLGFAGLAAFVLFLWIQFNEPTAFITAHNAKGWGDWNSPQALLDMFKHWGHVSYTQLESGDIAPLMAVQVFVCLLGAAACIIGWVRLPPAYAAWTTLVVVISYTRWGCFGRHFATAFPAFILAAIVLKDRRLYHGIVYLCLLLLALFTLMFTHGLWVA